MKDHEELLEAWRDGTLGEADARAFARRLAEEPELARRVALGSRIDTSLRRLFSPPTQLAPTGAPLTATRTWMLASAALVASAAAILILARVFVAPTTPPDPVADRSAAPQVCHVGPLAPSDAIQGRAVFPVAPDLDSLYQQARDFAELGARSCGSADDLAGALEASYGELVRLQPGAAGQLHGPFSSAEWPTGTILTGRPGDQMSVLVADLETTHRCCIHTAVNADSPLRTFTWQVGGLVLTEITPRSEPQLLAYFQVQG